MTPRALTLGAIAGNLKLEGSRFRGREPDQERWNIETPRFDSHAFRATWNPAAAWSLQASYGRLHSPEQLEPGVNVDRTGAVFTVGSASLSYRYDLCRAEQVVVGLGGLGSLALVPAALRSAYGERAVSGMVFVRARLR